MPDNLNILLINGFGAPIETVQGHLCEPESGNSIYLSTPLGVLTLAAWCKKKLPNYSIQILDANIILHKYLNSENRKSISLQYLLNLMMDDVVFIPKFVGLSMSSSSGHTIDIELCKTIKKRWNDSLIIAGGIHATTFTRKIIEEPSIDFVVRGPGDEAFINLILSLENKNVVCNIPGVVTSTWNTDSIANPLKQLDDIPLYPFNLIDMDYIITHDTSSPVSEEHQRTGMVQMSRGCPFHCSFCCAGRVHGKKVRFKSPERVVEEIEMLYNKYGINTLSIVDDLFGANKGYIEKIFDLISKKSLRFSIVFPGGLSVQMIDKDIIDILTENGLLSALFAIESGSPFVLKNIIKKNVDLVKARKITEYTKSKGIFTGAYFVLGLPGEDKGMIEETFHFVKELTLDWAYFFSAYPYPGTDMTEQFIKSGYLDDTSLIQLWNSSTLMTGLRNFDTKEMTAIELKDTVYDINIQINFFHNYNMRIGLYHQAVKRFDKIISRYPFHVVALACRARCYHLLGDYDKSRNDITSIYNSVNQYKEASELYNKYKNQIEDTISFSK